jgi:hypothetical protein
MAEISASALFAGREIPSAGSVISDDWHDGVHKAFYFTQLVPNVRL